MSSKKTQRRIQPAELLEMLDLEERITLADELHMTTPKSLNDPAFLNDVLQLSATTLLSTIVRLRRPFIQMLHDVYQFMEKKEASGRTTTRAVILPSARNDLQLLFDQAMKEAIATALNNRIVSTSIDSLEKRARELKDLIARHIKNIHGSSVRSETDVSRAMRYDPRLKAVARNFDRHRYVYHPKDYKLVESFQRELRDIIDKLDRLIQELKEDDRILLETAQSIFENLRSGLRAVRNKAQEMETLQPRHRDRDEPDKEIDENEWEKLLEKTRVLKEEILAACDFQTSATSICDFLNLELWRERWRIYELWILTHLLQLFENLDFKADISTRVSDEVWSLKFSKDRHPVALLLGDNVVLEVYYQLYSSGEHGGDMPDIAIKKKDGKFLLILDPKHGKSYDRDELVDLAKRYADAFSANLTAIHNFYLMSYVYEVVSENPRCLIVSDIRPGSNTIEKLDRDIISIVPAAWLPAGESIVILVDVSGSTHSIRNQMIQAVDKTLRACLPRALPGSVLMLFDDKIVREMLLPNIQNTNEVLAEISGGGTNLTSALETAIAKLMGMRAPRSLLLFTDGKASVDIVSINQKIAQAELQLQIYEAVEDSNEVTSLQKLAQISRGQYKRI